VTNVVMDSRTRCGKSNVKKTLVLNVTDNKMRLENIPRNLTFIRVSKDLLPKKIVKYAEEASGAKGTTEDMDKGERAS